MNMAANTTVVASDAVQPEMVSQLARGKSSLNSLAKPGSFAELLDESVLPTDKHVADEGKPDQQDPYVVPWLAVYPAGGTNFTSTDEACSAATVTAIDFAGDRNFSPAQLTGGGSGPLVASPFAQPANLGEEALTDYNGVLAAAGNDKLIASGSGLQRPGSLPDGLSSSPPTVPASSIPAGTVNSLAGQPGGSASNGEVYPPGPNVLATGQLSNTAKGTFTVYDGSDQPARREPINLNAAQVTVPVTADNNQRGQPVPAGLAKDSQTQPAVTGSMADVASQPGKEAFTGAVAGDKAGGLPIGLTINSNNHSVSIPDNNIQSSSTVLAAQTGILEETPDGFNLGYPPDSLDSSVAGDNGGKNDDAVSSSPFAKLMENNSPLSGLSADKTELKPAGQTGPQLSDVPAQIIKQINLTRGTLNSQMVIQLQPEHLGQLTLKVAVENGLVSATFHSDNPDVRGIIQSSLPELRQEITNQGLKVDYVGVYAGLGQFTSGNQQGNYFQPETKVINWKNYQNAVATDEEDGFSAGIISGMASGGVDYRI